ncbi:MAG: 50S ribosomal protein L32 [Spirochaetia bacterium]|nr:50S ribosomal protein L32 [Spirochaetia bacterium]
MANVTRKPSRSKSRSRRAANQRVKQHINVVECPQCHQKKMPHRVCGNCGYYAGRDVLKKEND